MNDFDELCQYYDNQLSSTLEEADDLISKIDVTSETTLTEYFAYMLSLVFPFLISLPFLLPADVSMSRLVVRRVHGLSSLPVPVYFPFMD